MIILSCITVMIFAWISFSSLSLTLKKLPDVILLSWVCLVTALPTLVTLGGITCHVSSHVVTTHCCTMHHTCPPAFPLPVTMLCLEIYLWKMLLIYIEVSKNCCRIWLHFSLYHTQHSMHYYCIVSNIELNMNNALTKHHTHKCFEISFFLTFDDKGFQESKTDMDSLFVRFNL